MVSPKSIQQKEETTEHVEAIKEKRKKKGSRGETVADRLIASAKRMEQLRISEAAKNTDAKKNVDDPVKPVEKVTLNTKKCVKLATHEIDDLSALEWETSSEQSGH